MAGNQGLHSAENGKKGGRPKLEATKLREALIRKAEERAEELAEAIIEKALDTKKRGDVPALKEVFDRGIGKVVQGLDHTTLGKELPSPILSVVNNGVPRNNGDEEGAGDEEKD